MLLEIAVGDAYGAGFEMGEADYVAKFNLREDMQYVNNPRRLQDKPDSFLPSLVKAGHYTDDTQLSIAIAEAMLDDGELWTRETLADRFVEVFSRDPRRGYTSYFFKALSNSNSGAELLACIGGKSTASGAAMRAGVVGLYQNAHEVVAKARHQARVTHDTWLGTNSAVGVALMTHYFHHGLGPKSGLREWLGKFYFGEMLEMNSQFQADGGPVMPWRPEQNRPVGIAGWDCMLAALHAIEVSETLTDVLWKSVSFGGDVDTVAAIAMGPASRCQEIPQDLPLQLLEHLEDSAYGASYLKALDEDLLAKFPPQKAA